MCLYCLSTILGYVQGDPRQRQLLSSFVEHFNGKSPKKKKLWFFSLILLNLIKKGIVHFFFAILAYVHNALWNSLFLWSALSNIKTQYARVLVFWSKVKSRLVILSLCFLCCSMYRHFFGRASYIKAMKTLRAPFLTLMLVNFIKIKILHFLITALAWVQGALRRKQSIDFS